MSGVWVFVCGASGAGKDSVIASARELLVGDTDVVLSQRLMTRPTPAGADHQGMDPAQFDYLLRTGGLAWHWAAHEFRYGIAARYTQQVNWGRVVVVNGSREHVAGLRRSPAIRVVQITSDAGDVAARLEKRGRDAPEAIARRLARNSQLGDVSADLVIANDGELAAAAAKFADYLAGLVSVGAPA